MMPVAAAGVFWAAGTFAENLLGGASGSDLERPWNEPGGISGVLEGNDEGEGGTDPEGGEASVEETGPAPAPKKK